MIATPLDDVFPKANASLQRRIGESNLVLSEFGPASKVTRANFPRRNRTMALVSDASVIVEAGANSGKISLGWEAIRLGRPLFLRKYLVVQISPAARDDRARRLCPQRHGRSARCPPVQQAASPWRSEHLRPLCSPGRECVGLSGYQSQLPFGHHTRMR